MKRILFDFYTFLRWKIRDNGKKPFVYSGIKNIQTDPAEKIFVIGMNKTGTTSIKRALIDLGFTIGHQGTASDLFVYDFQTDFEKKIIKYCLKSQAFQDIPFSAPQVYKFLYDYFPNAKFVLTVRDDADQWFNSMKKFTAKVFGNGTDTSKKDMIFAKSYRKGYVLIRHQRIFGLSSFFDAKGYKKIYEDHIKDVKEFFSDKRDQLLVLNVADENAYRDFCMFVNRKPLYKSFPWENKTVK